MKSDLYLQTFEKLGLQLAKYLVAAQWAAIQKAKNQRSLSVKGSPNPRRL
jgi:hypothetical protein